MKTQLLQTYLLLLFCTLLINIINVDAQVLTMTPGSHFIVNGTPSVIVNNAAINNNGTFNSGSGTVTFTGYSDTSVSYITGDSVTTLNNFTVNKEAHGVAIKGAVGVTNTLTMSTGNLYANSNLTLKSTAANTARVAPVPANCNIIGQAYVERYFPSYRAWRLVTAPLTNTGTIYNSWQNGGNYVVGRGTFITGPKPSATNGFDPSPENNYSMYVFNNSSQQFSGPATTKTNLSQGNNGSADNTGYMLFVRGDRNPSNLNVYNENATTISALGTLQTGMQTFTASSIAGKVTLIGNPYASPIDFSTLTRTNLLNRFYVWDPYLNTVGGFVVLDDLDGDGIYDKSIAGSSQTTIIQSGQAFFVQTAAGGAASLTVNENNKATTNNTLAFRPASTGTESVIANLYLLNADSTTTLADGALVQFNDVFSDSITLNDAPKMGNMNEALAFLKDGKSVSMARNPSIVSTDTISFNLTQTTMRSYQLELIGENFNAPNLTGYLQDTYLNTNTPINLAGNTKINFTLSSTAEAIANRFRIVFNVSNPLAVTFSTIKAVETTKGINIEWDVQNELNIERYYVEKSSDGINFTIANTTNATGNNNSSVSYSWLDENPSTGNNFYRVESIDKDGAILYSHIVRVSIDKATGSEISIYPNPVTGNAMNLQFSNEPIGNYYIHLYNAEGSLVYTHEVAVTGNNTVQALSLPSALAKGNYEVKIIGAGNFENIQNIIVE